jgi:two-component system, cell cycle sensor histidine kinase and response regulator CckA
LAGIAIVEDEYIVALDIKSLLGRSGYAIAGMYSSGDDLLEAFDTARPDLVLMDIKIRGSRDGVETARLVHELHRTPVVLLTAFADDETIARAKITQPYGYIIKPFEERELKTAIEIALYRASMERRLLESEERYRNLFYEGISANFLADGEGRVTEANQAFRSLLGLGPASPLPLIPSLLPDKAAFESFMALPARGGRSDFEELPLRSVDGRDLVVLAKAARIAGPEGSGAGIRGELIDTTERRRLEERLILTQKMDAAGKLAGGIAHDFNNILTAIIGYSNLLADELPPGSPAREDVDGIRKAADRAANLTRQLLAFSRRQPYSPKALDLNASVQDVDRLLRRILPENVLLSLSLSRVPATVIADPAQVEQVLLNLAFNARDAMPEGGELRLATSVESFAAPSDVGLARLDPGSYAVIEVADSGTGIPAEIADKIFEPFFTTKPRDRGTGLGLSTVYGIARQLGGSVAVESRPGRGSTFRVWIPLASAVAGAIDESETSSPWPKGRTATILYVDDDEAVRTLAARLLAKGGHRVLQAANAGEALLILESRAGEIDLLVTDIAMPLMDGRALAARVSGSHPGMGVLFVSAQPALAPDEAEGRFLAKPFSEAQLAEAVTRALAAD